MYWTSNRPMNWSRQLHSSRMPSDLQATRASISKVNINSQLQWLEEWKWPSEMERVCPAVWSTCLLLVAYWYCGALRIERRLFTLQKCQSKYEMWKEEAVEWNWLSTESLFLSLFFDSIAIARTLLMPLHLCLPCKCSHHFSKCSLNCIHSLEILLWFVWQEWPCFSLSHFLALLLLQLVCPWFSLASSAHTILQFASTLCVKRSKSKYPEEKKRIDSCSKEEEEKRNTERKRMRELTDGLHKLREKS